MLIRAPLGDVTRGSRGRASVCDAIWNPYRSKPAPRYKDARCEPLLDFGHSRDLPDIMLRAGAPPSIEARQDRAVFDSYTRTQLLRRQLPQRVVVKIDGGWIVGPSDKCTKQRHARRCAIAPLRRYPRAR